MHTQKRIFTLQLAFTFLVPVRALLSLFPSPLKDQVLTWAALASNPNNKEDPIDQSVFRGFEQHFGAARAAEVVAEYKVRVGGRVSACWKECIHVRTRMRRK